MLLITLTWWLWLVTLTGNRGHIDIRFIPEWMIVIRVILDRKQFSNFGCRSRHWRIMHSSSKSCLITLSQPDQSEIVLIKSNKIRLSLHLFNLCSSNNTQIHAPHTQEAIEIQHKMEFQLLELVIFRWWHVEVFCYPWKIFSNLSKDCVAIIATSPTWDSSSKTPADDSNQRPSMIVKILSHKRTSWVTLTSSFLSHRGLTSTQLLTVDFEWKVWQILYGVSKPKQLKYTFWVENKIKLPLGQAPADRVWSGSSTNRTLNIGCMWFVTVLLCQFWMMKIKNLF